jgi:hypothetical protein
MAHVRARPQPQPQPQSPVLLGSSFLLTIMALIWLVRSLVRRRSHQKLVVEWQAMQVSHREW